MLIISVSEIFNTDRSASYLDLHLDIDSEGRLRTKLYDKRDDFNFLIVNFPFICSNIPAAPAYGVYISELIRYSYNDQKKKYKRTNNDLQNIHIKLRIE
jgi:hypothetical protein